MSFTAREAAKQRFAERAEATAPPVFLDPVDPVRRAKRADGIPARVPGDTPNGTAQDGPLGRQLDYGGLTAAQVLQLVRSGDLARDEALRLEQARETPRVTILNELR